MYSYGVMFVGGVRYQIRFTQWCTQLVFIKHNQFYKSIFTPSYVENSIDSGCSYKNF